MVSVVREKIKTPRTERTWQSKINRDTATKTSLQIISLSYPKRFTMFPPCLFSTIWEKYAITRLVRTDLKQRERRKDSLLFVHVVREFMQRRRLRQRKRLSNFAIIPSCSPCTVRANYPVTELLYALVVVET